MLVKSCWIIFSVTLFFIKNTMNSTNHNTALIAKCGLYCGNCKKFISGKCAGCEANVKATWCKTRTCCIQNGYFSCADCETTNPRDCTKFSNIVSDIFSFVFRSDRPASVEYIKSNGAQAYVNLMVDQKRMVVKK